MLIFAVRLILEEDGKLLFLRQTKKNGGRFSLIGGNVEENEFAREALAREALEEAGIHVLPNELNLVHVLHRHKLKKDETLLVLYFKAQRFHGEPESLEPKKFKDVKWLPVNNLPQDVSKATHHVLQGIQRGEIYSEFPARNKVLAFWEQFGDRWAGFSDF
ncbi:MAG: NUDIX domain-containing protein [Saprospiraceae bacterium]|nr:NUDIX domain-containing protein [Saprospiraceae bacterium]